MTGYILCGAPGSGKTSYAKQLAERENAFVISGDEVREELFGSAEMVGNWEAIYDRIEELVSESCGMPVILDGTYEKREFREWAIALLRSYGYEQIEAVIMDVSLATCLARNFKRSDRNVPDYIVKKKHEDLQWSLKGIYSEDFDRISFIY